MNAALVLSDVVLDYNRMGAELYRKVGFEPPWVSYLIVAGDIVVGGCAFVGLPSNGRIEIAYYTLPEYQRRGAGTFAARALVDIAVQSNLQLEVRAKTAPEVNPSTAILSGIGFLKVGTVTDDEIGEAWEWRLPHPGPYPNT